MVQALRKTLLSTKFRFLAKEPVSNLSHYFLSNKQIRDDQSTSSQDGPLFDRSHCQCHLWNFRGAGQSKTGPNPLFGEVLQTKSIEMICGCLFRLVKYRLLKCAKWGKVVPDVKMGLFPKNDDIQKVLNFYKPPIHIYSMHIVWHQVTSILENVFCFETRKISPKNVGLRRWAKLSVFFSYVRKTRHSSGESPQEILESHRCRWQCPQCSLSCLVISTLLLPDAKVFTSTNIIILIWMIWILKQDSCCFRF